MAKKNRSVRLDEPQHRFLDQSTFEFSTEVREWLEKERIRNAAGLCADCGETVYIGGHTVVSGGSPFGNALGLGTGEEIDLCNSCEGALSRTFQTREDPDFDLSYLDSLSNYYLYRAERDAVANAQPDSAWKGLITSRGDLVGSDPLDLIFKWVETIDFEQRYNREAKLDAGAFLRALYREQERFA